MKELHFKFYSDDLDKEVTIKEYLIELLLRLWDEKEQFSGKRPIGNSGWEYNLYIPLVKNKIIKGKLDEDGYLENVDEEKADKIISDCIRSL